MPPLPTYLAPTDLLSRRHGRGHHKGLWDSPLPRGLLSLRRSPSPMMCRWKSPSPPRRGGSPWLAGAPGVFPPLFISLTLVPSLHKERRREEDKESLKRTIILMDLHPLPSRVPIPLPLPPPGKRESWDRTGKIERG